MTDQELQRAIARLAPDQRARLERRLEKWLADAETTTHPDQTSILDLLGDQP